MWGTDPSEPMPLPRDRAPGRGRTRGSTTTSASPLTAALRSVRPNGSRTRMPSGPMRWTPRLCERTVYCTS